MRMFTHAILLKTVGKFFAALTDDTIGWICDSSKMKPTSDKSKAINSLHLLGPLGTCQTAAIIAQPKIYQLLSEILGYKGNTRFENWWPFFGGGESGFREIDNNMANIGN